MRIWQAGLVPMAGNAHQRRVFYQLPIGRAVPWVVEHEWRYTVTEADRENERTLMFGPWVNELLELCEAARLEREGA